MKRTGAHLALASIILGGVTWCVAQPSTLPARPPVVIEFSRNGGFGGFSVTIQPDGTYQICHGEKSSGRLSVERHAQIGSAIQGILKLRQLPRYDPSVLDAPRYALSWGGVRRTWGVSRGELTPELASLERLLDPRNFEKVPPATVPATQPDLIATLYRRGGFAGVNDVARLYSDLHYSTGEGEEILSRAKFVELSDVLNATRTISSDYPAAAADAFEYTLEYDGRTIGWSEASGNLPTALRRLPELFDCMMTPEPPPATAASASQRAEGHGP